MLRVSVPCTKNKQISSQGAPVLTACHMSTGTGALTAHLILYPHLTSTTYSKGELAGHVLV